MDQDAVVIWTAENQPRSYILKTTFGEGDFKLWHGVWRERLWGNVADLHANTFCKSCLNFSAELASLSFVIFCGVQEVDVCMEHIQTPAKQAQTVTVGAIWHWHN